MALLGFAQLGLAGQLSWAEPGWGKQAAGAGGTLRPELAEPCPARHNHSQVRNWVRTLLDRAWLGNDGLEASIEAKQSAIVVGHLCQRELSYFEQEMRVIQDGRIHGLKGFA